MRCETSCFSLTLYKKLLTRNWPVWVVWFFIGLLALPVQLFNQYRDMATGSKLERLRAMTQDLDAFLAIGNIFLGVAAILTALLVFFYFFKSSAASFAGALPLRREGLFFTSFAAGYTMLAVPLVAVCLILLVEEAAMGCLNAGPIGKLLGGALLMLFFWLSFAALCCVISGHGVAAAVFYAIFNFIVLVMSWLFSSLCDLTFYGFTGFGAGAENMILWFTPFARFVEDFTTLNWPTFWTYAGTGFLMFLAALGLNHLRKAERVGEIVTFNPLRIAFKVCVIFCGGVALGMGLTIVLFNSMSESTVGWPLTLCCCVAGVICSFIAEMLLKKSLKVWHSNWKWALASAAFFVAFLALFQFDVFGVQYRVPAVEKVESAYLEMQCNTYVDESKCWKPDELAGYGLTYEGDEAVTTLADLHRLLAATDGEEYRSQPQTPMEYGSYAYWWVDLTYTLKSGNTLSRSYGVYLPAGHPIEEQLRTTSLAGKGAFDADMPIPDSAYVTVYVQTTAEALGLTEEEYQKALQDGEEFGYYTEVSLNASQIAKLWAAAREDVSAGRYAPQPGNVERERSVNFHWDNAATAGGRGYQRFYFGPETTSANAAMAQLFPDGVTEEDITSEGWDMPATTVVPATGTDLPAG